MVPQAHIRPSYNKGLPVQHNPSHGFFYNADKVSQDVGSEPEFVAGALFVSRHFSRAHSLDGYFGAVRCGGLSCGGALCRVICSAIWRLRLRCTCACQRKDCSRVCCYPLPDKGSRSLFGHLCMLVGLELHSHCLAMSVLFLTGELCLGPNLKGRLLLLSLVEVCCLLRFLSAQFMLPRAACGTK